jgi:hypothetical protein
MATRAPIPPPNTLDLDALARRFRLPIADLSSASSHAVALVPERWARRFHIVPLSATEHELLVATADPLDFDCERTLAFATGRHVRMALASTDDIARRIEDLYRGEGTTREPEAMLEVQHLNKEVEAAPPIPGEDATTPVTNLVDQLLAGGIASRASDIHIEPEEQGIAVRHRVDGLLTLARTLPRAVGPALVSRIKILSGLDIADRLRPQDGRARVAGTLAAHTVTLALDGGELGVDAAAHGGVQGDPANVAMTALAWNGTLDTLAGRGPWALRLTAPATLSLAFRQARLGDAHFTIADGTVDVAEFAWDDGRINSRGRFAAVPLAASTPAEGSPQGRTSANPPSEPGLDRKFSTSITRIPPPKSSAMGLTPTR